MSTCFYLKINISKQCRTTVDHQLQNCSLLLHLLQHRQTSTLRLFRATSNPFITQRASHVRQSFLARSSRSGASSGKFCMSFFTLDSRCWGVSPPPARLMRKSLTKVSCWICAELPNRLCLWDAHLDYSRRARGIVAPWTHTKANAFWCIASLWCHRLMETLSQHCQPIVGWLCQQHFGQQYVFFCSKTQFSEIPTV